MSARVAAAGALVVAALLPVVLSGQAVLNDMVLAAAYVAMALGLNIVVGFAGLLDLGYVAFYAIGSYTAAYLASDYWGVPGIHLPSLVVLAAAAAAAALAGAVIGLPTLRLRGDYIAIVTLAFSEIVTEIVANGDEIHLFGGTLTAGPNGTGPIDRIHLPFLAPFGLLDARPWYWCGLGLVALVLLVNVRLRDSRLGRAWVALREDEQAAAAAGVALARTKLLAYATGAALGGLAGAFLASYISFVDAGQFDVTFSIFIFTMVVVGGLGSIPGVVLGALLMTAVNNYVLPDLLAGLPSRLGLDVDLSAVSTGVYGFVIVAVMLLRPGGLVAHGLRRL